MSSRDSSPGARAKEAESIAAAWLARRDAGLNAEEEARLSQWLAADPSNAAAWSTVNDAWEALDSIARPGLVQRAIQELGRRRRRRRAKAYGLATAAAVAVVAVGIFVGGRAGVFQNERGRTDLAGADPVLIQPERRLLPDGSVAELNQGAEIAVAFEPLSRNVRLLGGQAHFEVTKDPSRPFIVTAGTAQIRAVGTAFAVGLGAHSVDVTVTEGKVAVNQTHSKTPSQSPVLVAAGNCLVVPSDPGSDEPLRAQPLTAAEIDRRLDWRAARLELSGTPLAKVIAALNRSSRVQLAIGDKSIADMRISGVFRADNAEGFVRLLETNYGIEASHKGDLMIVLGRGL